MLIIRNRRLISGDVRPRFGDFGDVSNCSAPSRMGMRMNQRLYARIKPVRLTPMRMGVTSIAEMCFCSPMVSRRKWWSAVRSLAATPHDRTCSAPRVTASSTNYARLPLACCCGCAVNGFDEHRRRRCSRETDSRCRIAQKPGLRDLVSRGGENRSRQRSRRRPVCGRDRHPAERPSR